MSDFDIEITRLSPSRHRVAVTHLVNEERRRHGDRLLILYGRGVAALEVAPRGAVL